MSTQRSWQAKLLASRWLAPGVMALMVGVLGATIFLARLRVEREIRQQLAGRDAEVLHQAVQLLMSTAAREAGGAAALTNPAVQFEVILQASRMKGVVAVRLFTVDGQFAHGLPVDVREAELSPEALAAAQKLRPTARYWPAVRFGEVFYTTEERPSFSAVEITVPLHVPESTVPAGIAQFLLEGHSLAAEFERLDRSLSWQAWVAFAVGSLILVGTVGWALRRLAERTASLQRANQQLALAARTSAVGAVTAHLVHGLKNPLAGLQNFIATHGAANGNGEADWEQAAASMKRMASLIQETVSVLQEEQAGVRYEWSLEEVAELVAGRLTPLARERGVALKMQVAGALRVNNRVANLTSLILANLAQNAIQATPAGQEVGVELKEVRGGLVCRVWDQGPGLPEQVREQLFLPVKSSKPGGSGLGLAISKQLAHHLGAELVLKYSTLQGCCFELSLPAAALAGEAVEAGENRG